MDIGGGSTELIIADQDKIYWKGSFNIGAARLLAKFKPSDPINNSEIQTIEQFLFSNLEPFFEALKLFPVMFVIVFDVFLFALTNKLLILKLSLDSLVSFIISGFDNFELFSTF
jgi:hypothetical protein